MKALTQIFLFALLITFTAFAQQTSFQDTLLDHMSGKWTLQGTIDGKETTHDIEASWVLAHQYFQFHEISREKNAKGEAEYEAIVYIGWDQPSGRYVCLWLDVTSGGGLSSTVFGYAEKSEGKLPFLFKGGDGSIFHTTFAYDKATDAWQWNMDGEDKGKLQPFARVKLTRK